MKAPLRLLRRIIRNVNVGMVMGASMGIFFCIIALCIFLFGGPEAFEANHVSDGKTLGMYLMAGILGGFVFGLALPLTRWMPGAASVAFFVAFIVWFFVGRSMYPREPLRATVKMSVLLGAAFGLPIGVGFWYQERRFQRTGKWS